MAVLFFMTADTACKVWDRFIMTESLSEEERIKCLMPFVESGEVEALNFDGTKDEVVQELSKYFKTMYLKRKEDSK